MNIISIALIVVSVILIILVLLQQRGDMSGFLGAGGGGGSSDFYQKRRGAEKTLYTVTILLIILFAALAVGNLFLNQPASLPAEQNIVNTQTENSDTQSDIAPSLDNNDTPAPQNPAGLDLNL